MTETQTGDVDAVIPDQQATVTDDATQRPKPAAWLAAAVIGAAVSVAAQLFLVFVGAGLTVPLIIGILCGTFIAGRRLKVHGPVQWIYAGMAVFAAQYVMSFLVGLVLGNR